MDRINVIDVNLHQNGKKNGVKNSEVEPGTPVNKDDSLENSNFNESSISLGKEMNWVNSDNPESRTSEIVPYTQHRTPSNISRSVTLGSKYNVNFDPISTPLSPVLKGNGKPKHTVIPQIVPEPKFSPEPVIGVKIENAENNHPEYIIPQIKVPKLELDSEAKSDTLQKDPQTTERKRSAMDKGDGTSHSIKPEVVSNLKSTSYHTERDIFFSDRSPKVSPRDVSKSVTWKQENQIIKTERRTEEEREAIFSRLYQIPAWKQKQMETKKAEKESKAEVNRGNTMNNKIKKPKSDRRITRLKSLNQSDRQSRIGTLQKSRDFQKDPKEKSNMTTNRSRSRVKNTVENDYRDAPSMKVSLTKCPICRNDIESPRSFPCLHTFCESCVASHFSNHSNAEKSHRLKCPVCSDTQAAKLIPPDSDIAKALPYNHYVANMLAQKGLRKCNPCKRARKSTDASSWCSYCAAPLCMDHGLYHQHLTSAGVHHVHEIGEIINDPDFAYAPGLCAHHNSQKLKLFCQVHQTPICEKCRHTTHRSCEYINFVDNEANALKTNGVVQDLLRKLDNMEEQVMSSIGSLNENAQLLEQNKDRDRGKIVSIKTTLTKELDQKEKILWKNLFLKFNEKLAEMKTEINSFERKRATTRFYRRLLNSIVQKGTGIQVLKELPFISQQLAVLAEKTHFRAAIKHNVTLTVTLNEDILKISALGTVVDIEIKPKTHAQHTPFIERKSMEKVVSQHHPKMPIEKPSHKQNRLNFLVIRFPSSSITGGAALGSKLVIADHTCKEVRGYSRDGTLDESLNFQHLPGNPFDVTTIKSTPGKDAMMFTIPHERKIVSIERDMKKLNQFSFTSVDECYGITYADNLLIVACLRYLAIWHIKEGAIPKPQPDFPLSVSNVQYVHALSKHRIYFTNSISTGSAYCITLDKTVIFSYSHPQLRLPYGITTDSTRNVFIAGYKSNNVHKLSDDGELLQIIAPKATILYKPRVLIECEKVIYAVHDKHKVFAIS